MSNFNNRYFITQEALTHIASAEGYPMMNDVGNYILLIKYFDEKGLILDATNIINFDPDFFLLNDYNNVLSKVKEGIYEIKDTLNGDEKKHIRLVLKYIGYNAKFKYNKLYIKKRIIYDT